jgi:hypothetical protein
MGKPDGLGKTTLPDALTLSMIRVKTQTGSALRLSFEDPKLRKAIPKRLAECGYVAIANSDARKSGGRWPMRGEKAMIYGKQKLTENERLAAARLLSLRATTPAAE